MLEKKKVAFFTLGCKLNFTETSAISRSFAENGFELVAEEQTQLLNCKTSHLIGHFQVI